MSAKNKTLEGADMLLISVPLIFLAVRKSKKKKSSGATQEKI